METASADGYVKADITRLKGLRCLASGGDTKLLVPPIGVKSEIGYSLYLYQGMFQHSQAHSS